MKPIQGNEFLYFHSHFLHFIISKGLFNFVVKWSLQAHMKNSFSSVAPRKPIFIHVDDLTYNMKNWPSPNTKTCTTSVTTTLLLHVLMSKLILKIFNFSYDIFQICNWSIWNNFVINLIIIYWIQVLYNP
jgi:hypothetical protein